MDRLPPPILFIIRHWWWLATILLCLLGWLLTKPDGPSHLQALPAGFRLSPDARLMLTSDWQIQTVEDQETLRTLVSGGASAFSADGTFLVIRSTEQQLDVVRTDDMSAPISIQTNLHDISSIAVNATGSMIAVGTYRGTRGMLTIWNTATAQQVMNLPPDGIAINQLFFTPDDRYLLVVGSKMFRVIDSHTWQTQYDFALGTNAVAFSSSQDLVALHDVGSTIALVMLTDPQARLQLPRHIPSPFPNINGLAFSPDGQYLTVTESPPNGTGMWDIFGSPAPGPTHMALVRVSDGAVIQRFRGPAGQLGRALFANSGQTIITTGPGTGLGFWNVAPRQPWEQWLRPAPFLGALLTLLYAIWRWMVTHA